jgi:uncharacterized protein (TIRG00374 family)
MSAGTRRILVNVLRVGVSAACVVLTLYLVDLRKVAAQFDRPDWATLLAELAGLAALMVVPLVFLGWRWWWLLRSNGFDVPFRRVFVLTWVGQFFNQFLPGSIGGDAAKMYLTARDEERKAAAAATVFLDRVIGLATMILVATAAVIPVSRDPNPKLRSVVITVLVLFGGMVVGYLFYFNRAIRGSRPGMWIKGRLPFRSAVAEVDGILQSMRRRPKMVAVAILQSLGAQFSAMMVAYGIAQALGIKVGLVPFLLFEVIIFILTALPTSMGGLGVRELAYVTLFGCVEVLSEQAVALSLLYWLSTLVSALPGGLLFALGRHRRAIRPVGKSDAVAAGAGQN